MTRATRKQKSDFHWCHGLLERMPCSESRLGEANCGVASGWFIFTFLLLSLLFTFSFASQCLVVSEVTSTTPCKEGGFARRIPPFYSIYTADTCFFLCFYPFPKSKETGQVALFSLLGVFLYHSQNQDERLSSLLILRHGCDVKEVEVNCSMD